MNNIKFLSTIFKIALIIMIIIGCVLVYLYFNMKFKEKKKKTEKEFNKNTGIPKKTIKTFNIASVFDFMDFDKIEDNMIIQKNGSRYVMVIECQGINYDLMSYEEKVSVEGGFIQFLNTISHPIQIYVQTRKTDLENSISVYKDEVNKIEQEYNKKLIKYENIMDSPKATEKEKNNALYEFTRIKNLYEYGKDIIYNTEKMSLNKNILNKKYYVIVPYFSEEIGQGDYIEEEIREMAFSELYVRSQAIIRTLSISGVVGRIMSSTELADLMYFSYNRDDAEIYGVDKAIKAGYNEMYSTAPDYIDKKMKILDEQIEGEAIKLAEKNVRKARTEKEIEYNKKMENQKELIENLAEIIINDNKVIIGNDVAEKAKEKIRKEKKNNAK